MSIYMGKSSVDRKNVPNFIQCNWMAEKFLVLPPACHVKKNLRSNLVFAVIHNEIRRGSV